MFLSICLCLFCCSCSNVKPELQAELSPGKNVNASLASSAQGYNDDPFDIDGYEAEDVYNVTLSLNPHGTPSLQKKAIQMRNEGNFEACIRLLDEAIEKSPDMSSLYYSKGRTLLMMQNYSDAYTCFQLSINKKPNAESYYFIGIINAYLKKYDESRKSLEDSMKLKPNVYALFSLGVTCDDLEENEKALSYFNQLLDMDKTMPAAWYAKGIVLCQLNRYQEARDAFGEALKLDYPRAQKALDVLKTKNL